MINNGNKPKLATIKPNCVYFYDIHYGNLYLVDTPDELPFFLKFRHLPRFSGVFLFPTSKFCIQPPN